MSKFIYDKIISSGVVVCNGNDNGSEYAIIRSNDYPANSRILRTTYGSKGATEVEATRGRFEYSGSPGTERHYIGVPLEALRKVKPDWCVTKDDLLAQYEALQRDGLAVGPLTINLRDNPELLVMAKSLWAEKLSQKVRIKTEK